MATMLSRQADAFGTTKTKDIPEHLIVDQTSLGSSGASPYLEVSFYPGRDHALDLRTVNTPSRLFAQALSALKPLNEDYAITTYEEAFNWVTVFEQLQQLAAAESFTWRRQEFYVVEFRSKLREVVDRELLFKLDRESHREATEAGGLLKYWYGSPDGERRNLATCVWRDKTDAILGGQGFWHKQARGIIKEMYDSIDVRGLRMVVEDGAEAWSFEPFIFH